MPISILIGDIPASHTPSNNFSSPTVANCILWGNTTDEIANSIGSAPIVTFSDIQGGFSGTSNIDIDPLLVDADGADNIAGTSDDDLRLQAGSPCANSGNNAAVPAEISTDLDGNPRISGGTVDLGAFEMMDDDGDGIPNETDQCPGLNDTLDEDGDGIPNCLDTPTVHNLTQATDHFTLQAAIDSAVNGDEIVADPGTYPEAIDFLGKAITLRSASGNPSDTIIDGSGDFHVVQCVTGETSATVLHGFTITGGNANGSFPDDRGGGMYNASSTSPTVTNCTISGNMAKTGGGMHNSFGSNPTVTHCSFNGNSADDRGGGMNNDSNSHTTVANCSFSGNSARIGGGMDNSNCSPTVTHCTFSGNMADLVGGGMSNFLERPLVTNCTFSGNTADSGGGMNNANSRPMVTNCTFSGNTANSGGGMNNNNSSPTITNCIFWGDSPDRIFNDTTAMSTIIFSNVQGGLPVNTLDGRGNIDSDPLFVDSNGADNIAGTVDDDLRLQAGSTAIDAGHSALVLAIATIDLDGNQRIVDVPATTDTGVGFPEVVDMGAYEFASSQPPCIPQVSGDLNCDGAVDLLDFAVFMLFFTGPS